MKRFHELFLFLGLIFFLSPLAFSDSCERLLKILAEPGVEHTLERLSEFRERGKESGSAIQKALHEEGISQKLYEMQSRLSERGVVASVEDLETLLRNTKQGNKEETKPKEEEKPTRPPELPEELDKKMALSGGSFHHRHHPDYLKAVLPDQISPVFKAAIFKTKGTVFSSPAWGPDGMLAVGSSDNNVYVLRMNSQTNKLEKVASLRTGNTVSSSPAWGPDGMLAVGSKDKHVYILRMNPQTNKLEKVGIFETNSYVASSPAWGPDGMLAVGSHDQQIYLLKPNLQAKEIRKLSDFQTEAPVYSSPSWNSDGLLAVGGVDKHIYVMMQNFQDGDRVIFIYCDHFRSVSDDNYFRGS